MRLALISGNPATGKTSYGRWLAENHGLRHINLENSPYTGLVFNRTAPAALDEKRSVLIELFGGASDLSGV